MRPNPQETADLVAFTEETLNGKFHFLCSVYLKDMHKTLKGIGSILFVSALPILLDM